MSNLLKDTSLSVLITECVCTHFSLTEFAKSNKKSILYTDYIYDFNVSFTTKIEEKKLVVTIETNLKGNFETKAELISHIKSLHVFSINNIEEALIMTERGKEMPEQAIIPLIGIACSNLRGMLAVKLEGSIYSNAIVPIIDVTNLIQKKASTIG